MRYLPKSFFALRHSVLFCFAASMALPGSFAAPPAAAESEDAPAKTEAAVEEQTTPRFVIVEKKKKLTGAIASEQVLRYLKAAESAWAAGDLEMAEQRFASALGVPYDAEEKEQVLHKMGKLYAEASMLPKAITLYERLAREFPDSRRLPDVYMDLGNWHRLMGAQELAISKYYEVIKSSLNTSYDQLDKYEDITLRAKLEIASTEHQRNRYQEALEMYQDLSREELKALERKHAHYEICYLLYKLGNYQQGISQIKLFLEAYPESYHASEMRYLLAKSYESLDRKPEALREVVQILRRESSENTLASENADYWRQRTGNELANEFYEQGDFRSALTIYQALAGYGDNPEWLWPAIHQIGLCFERLGLPEKAKLAYQEILDPESIEVDEANLSESLQDLRNMAKWRLEHLNWEDDLLARLNVLRTQQ